MTVFTIIAFRTFLGSTFFGCQAMLAGTRVTTLDGTVQDAAFSAWGPVVTIPVASQSTVAATQLSGP